MQRERRKRRVRKRVSGSTERPRLSVFRSHKNIYAQIIDDAAGQTLCAASSRDKELAEELRSRGGNRAAAAVVGRALAARARMRGIKAVAFDRSGYRYHGRVRALAEAAREAGLKF
jgi:large subunit ribosomal protein L18